MISQDLLHYDPNTQQLTCGGEWTLNKVVKLKKLLKNIKWPSKGKVSINGKNITKMDSGGAWLLIKLEKKLNAHHVEVNFINFSEQNTALLTLIESQTKEEIHSPKLKISNWLNRVGKASYFTYLEFIDYLNFVGQLTFESLRIIARPTHIRLNSIASTIYRSGYQALPIIGLLSFMIGVVIAYQMGIQLRNYGANIYIVDFLGLSVLREFAPLITAIMVAGRTGSSFTAQLGIMKINQEIDALNTMGVTPAELLVLPRIVGLFIALPLLTMWADIFGVLGGMVMANNMLNISWYDFLHRFPTVIPLRALLIGLGKAPVFALIIASIACFQGAKVEGSADSVGKQTTRSVVLSIFFIIVADAIFSIIFSKLKL